MKQYTTHIITIALLTMSLFTITACGGSATKSSITNTNNLQTNTSKDKIPKKDTIFVAQQTTGVILNEVLIANTSTNYDTQNGQFSTWIELYNTENKTIDISNYAISDNKSNPTKWKIPASTNIRAHGYLLIWIDGENHDLHTNFKLKTKGETLIFTNANGEILSHIKYAAQKSDISFQPVEDALVYMYPTPLKTNTKAYPHLVRSQKPTFSQESGFYTNNQTISLSLENTGDIYYTTDGAIPSIKAIPYTHPIMIDKTTVIRARSLQKDKFLSATATHTFLINEDISLPIMSIATDDKYLFDSKIGIYKNFEEDWMRPASIEYIKDGKTQFSENVGVRVFGHRSRLKPQKSLAIFAKDKYGTKSFKYQLFDDKPQIKELTSFVLRNSGNDWEYTHIRDGLFNTLIKDNMDLDHIAYQPSVVFINGNYEGILNIREKHNLAYLKNNHPNIKSKHIDLLAQNSIEVLEGSDADYKDLLSFLKSNALADNNNYQYIKNQVDIIELINYFIAEIYIANTDWPGSNIKYWKEKTPEGKWRWILYDLDFGFGRISSEKVTDNSLRDTIKSTKQATLILRKLLENENFKNLFVSRFTTHLNTTFSPNNVNRTITKIKDTLNDDMPRNLRKWEQYTKRMTQSSWERDIQNLRTYATQRNDIVRTQLANQFSLTGNLDVHIPKPAHGSINIDGVKLNQSYDGNYFTNSTITLKAIPEKGYTFTRWSNGQTEDTIQLNIHNNTFVQALFSLQ